MKENKDYEVFEDEFIEINDSYKDEDFDETNCKSEDIDSKIN